MDWPDNSPAMVLVRVRKVVRSGGALVVSLPPDWLRGRGICPGDFVELAYDEIVRIRPVRKSSASDTGVPTPGAPAAQPAKPARADGGIGGDDG